MVGDIVKIVYDSGGESGVEVIIYFDVEGVVEGDKNVGSFNIGFSGVEIDGEVQYGKWY